MSDNNTSTFSSYVDSAKGTAQSVMGSVTGNTSQQTAGADKRDEATVKDDLSHATAKVGPYSATPSGGVAKDHPDRSEGSWNQTIGSGKETIGNLVGAEGLKQQGIEQNREGKAQEAHGQLSDLGQGAKERATGALGGAFSGVTGDREGQQKYADMHDAGKTRQRGAEADVQKEGGNY